MAIVMLLKGHFSPLPRRVLGGTDSEIWEKLCDSGRQRLHGIVWLVIQLFLNSKRELHLVKMLRMEGYLKSSTLTLIHHVHYNAVIAKGLLYSCSFT